MIGAMPAIAVRGKGKADGSIGFISRPHKLSLHFRPPLMPHQVTPTPSPINSPPGVYLPHRERAQHRFARNFLSKRCIFQLSVLLPLVGAILLFIGLIQLTPGAEANPYGVPLIIAGSSTLSVGLLVILLRVYCTWELNRLNQRDVPQIKVNEPSLTEQDVEKQSSENNVSANNVPVSPSVKVSGERKGSVLGTESDKRAVSNSASPIPSPIKGSGSPHPSPKAPPRSKHHHKDSKGKEEVKKLLPDSSSKPPTIYN